MTNFAAIAAALPSIPELRRRCLAGAMVEVLLSPLSDWGRDTTFERRYANGWYVYVNRNGAGDEVSITFTPRGAVIRCFSHESEVSPYAFDPLQPYPGLLDGLPSSLRPVVDDPAWDAGMSEGHKGLPLATFFFWQERGASRWSYGTASLENANEGAEYALYPESALDLYHSLVKHQHEPAPPRWAVEHVFEGKPLTEDLVAAFSPGRSLAEVMVEARLMGYTSLPSYWEKTSYRDA